MTEKIYVTRPFLPPLDEFIPYLQQIWSSGFVTNSGPFHEKLESSLAEYLGVNYLSLFSNGTIALLTALQALRIRGEVITTPYSFVATSHSLIWNDVTPVFVDIDPVTCNIDPSKIEQAITPSTSAIMPVHCYGNPCDVDQIQKIADNYGLRVIYDAAHAFGINYKGGSLLRYGDLSVLSFHATKVFNTLEGGAIISHDHSMKQRVDKLKNFGFSDEVTVVAPGINGKMNEVQAALGLLQLDYVASVIRSREVIDKKYRVELCSLKGITLLNYLNDANQNFSYFPILIQDNYQITRDELYEELKKNGIMSRRYFYPLISSMPIYRGLKSASIDNLPNANDIANKILCLPIHHELTIDEQNKIIAVLRNFDS